MQTTTTTTHCTITVCTDNDHTLTLSLRIRIYDDADYGRYTCFASNRFGQTEQSMTLYGQQAAQLAVILDSEMSERQRKGVTQESQRERATPHNLPNFPKIHRNTEKELKTCLKVRIMGWS